MTTTLIFDTPDDFFAAMFGPPQHDAHATTRVRHRHMVQWEAWSFEADKRVAQAAWEIIQRTRVERAVRVGL